MRRELLDILRCPVCRTSGLDLTVESETHQEVHRGALRCTRCGQEYEIESGVVKLSPSLHGAARLERDVRDAKVRDWKVELQRPYINDAPARPWLWPSFAANVEQGLAEVKLQDTLALDIGAATCWSTRMMCERGADAVALDVSTGMLRDGEAQFGAGVFFDRVAATMEELPFVDGAFGVVFASATIHHSEEIERVFGEIGRVLGPGGQAVLVNEPVLGLLRRASLFGESDREEGMNERIYRLWNYVGAARRAGMEVQVLFPAALRAQLAAEIPGPDTVLARMAKWAWQRIPKCLGTRCLLPGHVLVGLMLVMVGTKAGIAAGKPSHTHEACDG